MAYDKERVSYRRLNENDVIEAFDCGDEDLNNFITNDRSTSLAARCSRAIQPSKSAV